MLNDFIILFIILVALYYYIKGSNQDYEVAYVLSDIDNRKYIVRNLPDKLESANLLAKLNQNALKLIEHLEKKYPDDDRVKRLKQNYNPDALSEGSFDNKYTSYSVNKGEKIVLCLRDRKTNELIDLNTISFVKIHEDSHLMTLSVGHNSEFWSNFKFLLKEAVSLGIYKSEDYSQNPKSYCGVTITSNPLFNSDSD